MTSHQKEFIKLAIQMAKRTWEYTGAAEKAATMLEAAEYVCDDLVVLKQLQKAREEFEIGAPDTGITLLEMIEL